jgi:hypothetical protein
MSTAPVMSNLTKRMYRRQSLTNMLRMGHCAPSIMQTFLDIDNSKAEWLVKLTAGLPGGIGNTGFECGGVTAPLILLGLDNGLCEMHDGLPTVFYVGHEYCHRFQKCNKSLLCKDIRGDWRLPLPCINVVRYAPELYKQTGCSGNADAISGETREAFSCLYSHLSDNDFHCAISVLRLLNNTIPITKELLDGTSAFMGGTVFNGMTCSALTAGIMAVGLKIADIENSHLRVIRMVATMLIGGNAFDNRMNKFNRVMNIGNGMAERFAQEFGSTLCNAVTQCAFASVKDVDQYIEKGSVATCMTITEKVARQVEKIIEREQVG